MKRFRLIFILILCVSMFANVLCVNAVTFDLGGQIDGEVSNSRISTLKPFVNKAKATELQFYLDDLLQKPIFRMKFDEGEGSTVKESVTGRTFKITGDDYEWINNADIRFGGEMPERIKQTSALRLNNSYIDLGQFAELADIKEGLTIAFWTNFEVFGRNEDYEEPYYHQYSQVKTYGSYKTAYKYDKNRYNVIFQSDNAKMCLKDNKWIFDGISDKTIGFGGALANNDYYNMYIIVVKKNDAGEWVGGVYGDDRLLANATNTLTNWGSTGVFDGHLYIGTPNASGDYGSMQLGIADLMVFDKPLSYQQRLELYYGYKQLGYYKNNVPTE